MTMKKIINAKYIVVHCSATKPDMYVDGEMIDRWHRERGFLKIGYHWVIRRDGTLDKGREIDERGAHVRGFNSVSVGVCLVGGIDEEGKPDNNFTNEQFEALNEILAACKQTYPKAEILGHRDLPRVKKACPSFDVREWLKNR